VPIAINGRTLREAVWSKDSYGLLFLFLIVDYLVLMLVNSPRWGGLARTLPIAVTVLFAMHTSAARRHVLRVAQGAVVIAFLAGIAQAIAGNVGTAAGISFVLVGLMLAVTPVAILRRILPKVTVEVETLFAAVDVYIIIGLIFSVLFIAIAKLYPHPPHVAFLAQPGYHPPSNYVYLSFVTLTTVGFGDLTPLSNTARSVVVLEALIGQIFLVTLVARLVSLYSAEHRTSFISRQRPEGPSRVRLRRRAGREGEAAPDAQGDLDGDDLAAADLGAAGLDDTGLDDTDLEATDPEAPGDRDRR
jgi:Ion channel